VGAGSNAGPHFFCGKRVDDPSMFLSDLAFTRSRPSVLSGDANSRQQLLLNELELPRDEERGEDGNRDSGERAEAQPDCHRRTASLIHSVKHGPSEDQAADLVRDERSQPGLHEQSKNGTCVGVHPLVIARRPLEKG